ncbi:hypothetical protein DPMN_080914 [Dreissena polymorpha]|uniref:Uncharacterized protein n=1 Tax=Dreissena polymorpha TaxID=45954 RepID=A0A9D3Y6H0_DREPO|nr:hypothetical protein DPMN_080914 [Dreissena polymorpha]
MGIDWNPRQDGTKRSRRLRGNSSASPRHEMALYMYFNTQSPAYIHIYFWEYTSREIRVIDTITGNSQTNIHSHRLTYIFWEWPSR